MKVLGVSGSLRDGSFNTSLLRAAAEAAPDGVELELWEGLAELPLYDEELDTPDAPAPVRRLREAWGEADAILFATPEYNGSVPGSLKNAIDWASRPARGGALQNKTVAVVGASTGGFGAVWAQAELRKVLGATGARVIDGDVAVGHTMDRFDENGRLTDENLEDELREVVSALLAEIQSTEVRNLAA